MHWEVLIIAGYKMVMFDMDGTLIDSFDFHAQCFQRFLKNFDVDLTLEQVSEHIGHTLKTILNATIKESRHQEAMDYLSDFYANDVDDLVKQLKVIDGALEVVNAIKEQGMITTILTNSKSELVENIITQKDMGRYFDDIKAADSSSLDKYERCINMLDRFDVKPNEVLYVGDTSHDMILAHTIGMTGCLIDNKYSWIHKENVAREQIPVDFTVSEIRDVKNIV